MHWCIINGVFGVFYMLVKLAMAYELSKLNLNDQK